MLSSINTNATQHGSLANPNVVAYPEPYMIQPNCPPMTVNQTRDDYLAQQLPAPGLPPPLGCQLTPFGYYPIRHINMPNGQLDAGTSETAIAEVIQPGATTISSARSTPVPEVARPRLLTQCSQPAPVYPSTSAPFSVTPPPNFYHSPMPEVKVGPLNPTDEGYDHTNEMPYNCNQTTFEHYPMPQYPLHPALYLAALQLNTGRERYAGAPFYAPQLPHSPQFQLPMLLPQQQPSQPRPQQSDEPSLWPNPGATRGLQSFTPPPTNPDLIAHMMAACHMDEMRPLNTPTRPVCWASNDGIVYQSPAAARYTGFTPQSYSPVSLPSPFNHTKHPHPAEPIDFAAMNLSGQALNVNPVDLDLNLFRRSRYFVIKSNTTYNVEQSIRHGLWCSTPAGNEVLHEAYCWAMGASSNMPTSTPTNGMANIGPWVNNGPQPGLLGPQRQQHHRGGHPATTAGNWQSNQSSPTTSPAVRGRVLLFFSVNSSGFFCGVAEMMSPVDKLQRLNIWEETRWRGAFQVRWLYLKNVPNRCLRHIQVESQENRAVTNLRDTNEILSAAKGEEMLKIIHNYR